MTTRKTKQNKTRQAKTRDKQNKQNTKKPITTLESTLFSTSSKSMLSSQAGSF